MSQRSIDFPRSSKSSCLTSAKRRCSATSRARDSVTGLLWVKGSCSEPFWSEAKPPLVPVAGGWASCAKAPPAPIKAKPTARKPILGLALKALPTNCPVRTPHENAAPRDARTSVISPGWVVAAPSLDFIYAQMPLRWSSISNDHENLPVRDRTRALCESTKQADDATCETERTTRGAAAEAAGDRAGEEAAQQCGDANENLPLGWLRASGQVGVR